MGFSHIWIAERTGIPAGTSGSFTATTPQIGVTMMYDIDLSILSFDAKAVAGGWFGMMGNGSTLCFDLIEQKPTKRSQDALDELVIAGFVSVEAKNRYGGLIYRPLVNCRPALQWLYKRMNDSDPEISFPLTEPVAGERDALEHQAKALKAGAA